MQAAKEKISNLASVAKERMTICKAKVEEQAELTTARTAGDKELARERRKVKGAQAKMELHQAKAKHAAEKLSSKHHHHQLPVAGTQPVVGTHANQPVGTGGTMPGTTAPAYPLGGHPPGHGHI
ncbi:hypothetical protein D5086_001297 [Populus alba]|uniref:Late embryogenesis abundant group 1 domain-containing family protein n=3 Tax=Populus TaxID=3689 RepID=A0A4U5NRB7_POPAL|nr:late embryogenesis abundant protein 18-like [Populus alba]KAJ7011213.1 late embryogenesis abundant protein 18-like [Populus alba x Populus x berolinensis]TKR85500.1 late embryogenesis abundant group 1 domain-containing family protein [Populus alba]